MRMGETLSSLSDRVLSITTTYLGPASKVFLERQTRSHMNGLEFGSLEPSHLLDLSRWVLVSSVLLIDRAKAQELAERVAMA